MEPITLPPSDWYVGSSVSQSQESGHNAATIQAMVDFYFQKGYLLNLYGHSGSTGGNMKTYVDDAVAKGAEILTGEITNLPEITSLVQRFQVDRIIHTAGLIGVLAGGTP